MPCNDLPSTEIEASNMPSSAKELLNGFSTQLSFYVNDTQKTVSSIDPRTKILEYLRANGYTGTKTGCNEGACGACTIVLADYDSEKKLVRYRSANACLLPLCSAHNKQIITIEGLGKPESPHPIQVKKMIYDIYDIYYVQLTVFVIFPISQF